jgi:hypothetical protein
MVNNASVAPTHQETKNPQGFLNVLKDIFSVSSLFVAFKYIAFIGFTAVSGILNINMFYRLSPQPMEQFALVGVSITLEIFKIFSIVRGNTLWRLKLKAQATRAYAMYLLLAILAVMASYGFTLTVINRNIQVNNSSAITLQIENSKAVQKGYESSIKSIETNIAANQARLGALPPDFISASTTLNDTLSKLQITEADLQAKLATERANQVTLESQAIEATKASTTSTSMFKLMAEGFRWLVPNLDENTLMLFLLLIISVVIELGIISTSPAIPIDPRHLKHFLDEMSAHKAEALLDEVQGRKKKETPRRQTLAGRVAQWWFNTKNDVNEALHPIPKKTESQSNFPTIRSSKSSPIPHPVPLRRSLIPVIQPMTEMPAEQPRKEELVVKEKEQVEPSQPWSRSETPVEEKTPTLKEFNEELDAITSDIKVMSAAEVADRVLVTKPTSFEDLNGTLAQATEELAQSLPPAKPAPESGVILTEGAKVETPEIKKAPIPVRHKPAPAKAVEAIPVRPEHETHSQQSSQLVAEARIYRFGKTTEAVKNMFVVFIQNLFDNNGGVDAPLNDVALAANSSGVAVSLADTFVKRLLEIKGSRGTTLIERREDTKLYPNYPEGYIITYATAEPSRERVK